MIFSDLPTRLVFELSKLSPLHPLFLVSLSELLLVLAVQYEENKSVNVYSTSNPLASLAS